MDRVAPHRRSAAPRLIVLGVGLLLVLGVAGCGTFRGGSPPPVTPETPSASVSPLDRADAHYAAGDYAAAADLYHGALATRPGLRAADRILFRLGVIHLLPDSPARDRETGRSQLRQLIAEHPESPWTEPARLLLQLDSEVERLDDRAEEQEQTIRQLEERLAALKRIDLEHSGEPPPR